MDLYTFQPKPSFIPLTATAISTNTVRNEYAPTEVKMVNKKKFIKKYYVSQTTLGKYRKKAIDEICVMFKEPDCYN
jgi:hypothetical protein